MPAADIQARLAPGTAVDLMSADGWARLLSAHLSATPRALWTMGADPMESGDVGRVRRGECTILERTLTVNPATDWHLEPFHGVRWPRRHVDSCPFTQPGSDLVLLWHLNKMMFLDERTRAYRTTGDAAFARDVYDLIDSWSLANPYLVGMNWISPLEVGLRLVAWSTALAGIADAPPPANETCERIVRAVMRQADFLAGHFSRWAIPNNHLIGEAAALSALAAYWPVWRDAPAWMRRAEETLVEETHRQILKDGFQFENSVNYHLDVLDFLLVYLHACAVGEQTPHPVILEKTREMADAVLTLPAPSGRVPMIGDDSKTRFVVLGGELGSPGPVGDVVAFERFVRPAHARVFATAAWGRELLSLRAPLVIARRFQEVGIDVARDAHSHLVFTHGPQHRRPFSHGHLHADAGSFELELDGVPLVVDSGTHLYGESPGARNHMRSAKAHNTVQVDGVEPMQPGAAFEWASVATGEALAFGAGDDSAAVGCRRRIPADGTTFEHVRALIRVGTTLIVVDAVRARDELTPGRAHTVAAYFHTTVAPGAAARDGRHVRLTDAVRFVRVFEVLDDPRVRVDVIDDPGDCVTHYSRRYGDLTHGVTIRVGAEFAQPAELVSVIRDPDVSVERLRAGAGEVLCAITLGHARRIVGVRMDPFAVRIGDRTVTDAPRAERPGPVPSSGSMDWLDEFTT